MPITIWRNPLFLPATMGILGPVPVFSKKFEAGNTDIWGPLSSQTQLGGINSYTLRIGWTTSQLADVSGATEIRVECAAGSSGYTLSDFYIGQYNSTTPSQAYWPGHTPVQVKFDGSAGHSFSSNEEKWSDWATMSYDDTEAIVASFYSGSGSYTPRRTSQAPYKVWRRFGNYVSVNSASGFQTYTSYSLLIKTIQVNA